MRLWEDFKDRFCCKPRSRWWEVCDDLDLKMQDLIKWDLWWGGDTAISQAMDESRKVLQDGKDSQPFELSMHTARQRRNLMLTAGVSLASGWSSTGISATVMSWAGIAAGVAESTVLVALMVSTLYQIFHFWLNATGETRHQCDKAFGASVVKLDPKALDWRDLKSTLTELGRHIEIDPLNDPQVQEFLKQVRYAFRPVPGVNNFLISGFIAVHINREKWRLLRLEIGLPCSLGAIGIGLCSYRLYPLLLLS